MRSACDEVDQRPDDPVARRGNPAEAARASTAEQPQQHRLGLVVRRVGHGHDVGVRTSPRAFEKRVAEIAGGALDRRLPALRLARHVHGLDVEGHVERAGEVAAEARIARRFRAAKAVVEMRDGDELEGAGGGELREQMRERDGIGAAGHRGEDARAVREQSATPKGRQHARGKSGHEEWCALARRAFGARRRAWTLWTHGPMRPMRLKMVPVQGLEPRTPRI